MLFTPIVTFQQSCSTDSRPMRSVVFNPTLRPKHLARYMVQVNLCTNGEGKRHKEMLRVLTSSSATQVAEQMLVSFHTESRSTDRRAVSSSCSSCTDRQEARENRAVIKSKVKTNRTVRKCRHNLALSRPI
jgi:hypothetical protein